MCGICGIWGDPNKNNLIRMLNTIKHRGPDDTGLFCDDNIAFGMNRLSILDTSDHGHQPMNNANGTIRLIYNGEMYNYLEEKKELEKAGFHFQSNSDTEVVLFLYEKYGLDGLNRIRGMFSLAIYDQRGSRPVIILSRDSMGIKPLYYYLNNGILVFASELKAMLASSYVNKTVDKEAFRQFFMHGSVNQPDTMVENVKMLLPGTVLVFNGSADFNELSTPFIIDKDITKLDYAEQLQFMEDTLDESVSLHLQSDVPFGAFLSGGVDSSLIVALMQKNLNNQVRTFSVGFQASDNFQDEVDEARIIANYLGVEHEEVLVTGKDFKHDFFDIIKAIDQPSIDGINSYYVSKAATRELTVALSGTGGDELFAGYPWFVNMMKWSTRFSSIERLKEAIKKQVYKNYKSEDFLTAFSMQYFIHSIGEYKDAVVDNNRAYPIYPLKHAYKDIDIMKDSDIVNRVTALCFNGYLRNQLLRDIDSMSMTHSLEVRVPFIDKKVLQAALSLDVEAKIKGDYRNLDSYSSTYKDLGTKRILIDIGKKYLPKNFEIQPKRGFSMPFDKWMRENVTEYFKDALCKQAIQKRGVFSYRYVEDIYSKFTDGTTTWAKVWPIVLFEYWCRENLD